MCEVKSWVLNIFKRNFNISTFVLLVKGKPCIRVGRGMCVLWQRSLRDHDTQSLEQHLGVVILSVVLPAARELMLEWKPILP